METKKMDVVYVLGNGSKWKNNEIRFSLRSIEKNLSGFRNVVIVGELPDFLQNVIHIKAEDIFNPKKNADGNIITKVLAACNDSRVSDDFLFINDDHLVIQPIHVADVPPLHKGDMTTYKSGYWKLNFWRKRLRRTMEVLRSHGLSTLHFDCHTPIIFNKEKFKDIIPVFNYQDDIGYTMKSLYGNVMYPDGPFLTDQKKTVFRNYTLSQLNKRLGTCTFMSFNDQGLNHSLKWWLMEYFPEPSSYEKTLPREKIIDLWHWNKQGRPYKFGVELFERYYHHKNLIRLFKMGETKSLRKKLDYALTQRIKGL